MAKQANLKGGGGTAVGLEFFGLPLPMRMCERNVYADNFAHGLAAFDIDCLGMASRDAISNSRKR